MINKFVEYQTWADLGPYLSAADFAAWHMATAHRVLRAASADAGAGRDLAWR